MPPTPEPETLMDELALELMKAARILCRADCGKSATSHTKGCIERSRPIALYDAQRAAREKDALREKRLSMIVGSSAAQSTGNTEREG